MQLPSPALDLWLRCWWKCHLQYYRGPAWRQLLPPSGSGQGRDLRTRHALDTKIQPASSLATRVVSVPELTHWDVPGCAEDKIDQDWEECCVEPITRRDIHQQGERKTCKDRQQGGEVCVAGWSQQPPSSQLSWSRGSPELLPCSTDTSPVLMPEMISLRIHSLKRYAGSHETMGKKRKAILLAFCREQL